MVPSRLFTNPQNPQPQNSRPSTLDSQARRFFHKSTTLNPYFAPAWLGYGHTFSAQDESDQALAAYRTASRFFCGCHLPTLCIGMEYAKTGNLTIAEQFFGHATGICSFDPLAFNEIGVVRYLQQDYQEAANAFEQVAHTYTLNPKS